MRCRYVYLRVEESKDEIYAITVIRCICAHRLGDVFWVVYVCVVFYKEIGEIVNWEIFWNYIFGKYVKAANLVALSIITCVTVFM